MSNELTKADARRKRKASKQSDTLLKALQNGGPIVWLSCLIMGLGNLFAGQIVKGLLFAAMEAAMIIFMVQPMGGIHWLSMLPGLGEVETQEIWDEEQGIFVYEIGDNSQLILLYGVATVILVLTFVVMWRASVRSGYKALSTKRSGKHVPNIIEDVKSLFDANIHKLLMTPPFMGLLIFTIVPLIYMITMAFTNYSKVDSHLILFDWVGLENFRALFNGSTVIGKQFWSVLGWTLTWAFFATFLNFFFGTFVAMIINRPTTRLKGLWRTVLSLTIAVPQFVSLLVIRTMFKDLGIVNTLLVKWGFLAKGDFLPFMSDTTWARVFVIVINLWVGIPYTVMQVTGILKNIPAEQYESARLDGANAAQQFRHITLPYMLFVLTPYLITQFTGNINNFNVIYLLTAGNPIQNGMSAGDTDLLVTWLYKLSVDNQRYNMAAVIGIFTFIVLSIVALVTYRSSGSYKDEEGFR